MLSLASDQLQTLAASPTALGPVRSGRVLSCDGGLLEISGLPVPIGTICRIGRSETGPLAEVIGFRAGHSLAMLLGDTVLLHPGASVRPLGEPGMVRVGEAFLGRAVDAMGLPLDGLGPIRAAARWPLAGRRGHGLDRARVSEPFDTGVRAINALATMGVGQRLGIIAGSGVGKSTLIDMIAQGSEADIAVVALIGERAREVADFLAHHMQGPMRRRIVIVAVPADHAANLRLRGAHFATALAEYFRSAGANVTLIVDSLTRIAHAAREIALLLGEPGAARGYPPSALACITRLVERAGKSASRGAITGLYTVLADGDDHEDPVVDTARAILDGHIVLSREMAQRGVFPAIDVNASLSRVMADIAAPEHRAAARAFRQLMADHADTRDLVLMGAYREGSNPAIDRAMAMHDAMQAFIAQDVDERVSLADSIALLAELTHVPA